MTAEQFEFIMAIETYKKVNKKMYPTWTEVLEVIRQLGYRRVEPPRSRSRRCTGTRVEKTKPPAWILAQESRGLSAPDFPAWDGCARHVPYAPHL